MKNFRFSIFDFQYKKALGIIIILSAIIILYPKTSLAATIYFEPAEKEFAYGDVFAVTMKIDLAVGEECINTVEATVNFDRDYLEAVDFSAGESILSLWLTLPQSADMASINHEKRLKFAGGVPGGYCGKIPGDPGDSNILGKIYFKVTNFNDQPASEPSAKVYFSSDSKVLLNDGQGTQAQLVTKEASYNIMPAGTKKKEEWDNLLLDDKTPPEPFIIEIQRQQEVGQGRYYLIFTTVDKQSGIDHYEVLEITPAEAAGQVSWTKQVRVFLGLPVASSTWQTASLPYVLRDQKLASIIRVKAVDKAGNERIVEYLPTVKKQLWYKTVYATVALLILLVAAGLALLRGRRKKTDKAVNF